MPRSDPNILLYQLIREENQRQRRSLVRFSCISFVAAFAIVASAFHVVEAANADPAQPAAVGQIAE